MSFLSDKRKRKIFIGITVSLLVLLLLVGACALYLSDYYPADLVAIEAFAPMQAVSVRSPEEGVLVFEPKEAVAGLIFYPGGKVEHTAYQPLMAACAEQGILCILLEMPFNLAVFDVNAADGMREMYPAIKKWYIGGHSLGGSMAASYLAEHTAQYAGLVLLGSYSTVDLSATDLDVLSIYGSEDKVLNREKYEESKANLPSGFTEIVIKGGCHAYFGMYGAQDGDGTPTISCEEQIRLTAGEIAKTLRKP